MKPIFPVVALLTVLGAAQAEAATPPAQTFSKPGANDVLTRMFQWWNAAYRDPKGFTAEAFGRYFTADAVMRINGRASAKGLDDLASHFRMIQQRTQAVEIKLPFEEAFSSPDGSKIFTYHLIDAVDGGKPSHEMVMGYASIRDGKIALINFASVEPKAAATQPAQPAQ